MDWWPTFVKLAGGAPPPHIWKDNKGKGIVFDGIDNSDYILGYGPSKRDHFFYINDLEFGGLRVTNFKVLWTAKDTWLGPNLNLDFPAIYNLYWDPGEQYDVTFRGAAHPGRPEDLPRPLFGRGPRLGGFAFPALHAAVLWRAGPVPQSPHHPLGRVDESVGA